MSTLFRPEWRDTCVISSEVDWAAIVVLFIYVHMEARSQHLAFSLQIMEIQVPDLAMHVWYSVIPQFIAVFVEFSTKYGQITWPKCRDHCCNEWLSCPHLDTNSPKYRYVKLYLILFDLDVSNWLLFELSMCNGDSKEVDNYKISHEIGCCQLHDKVMAFVTNDIILPTLRT